MTPDWEVEARLEHGAAQTPARGERLLLTPPLPAHLAASTLRRLAGAFGGEASCGGAGEPGRPDRADRAHRSGRLHPAERANQAGRTPILPGDGTVLRYRLPRLRSPRRAVRLLRRELRRFGFPEPDWEVGLPVAAGAAFGVGVTASFPDPLRAEAHAEDEVDEARALELLDGRIFRLAELERRLDERGDPIHRSRLVRLLHRAALSGACAVAPGVGLRHATGWAGWACSRCGSTDGIELRDCAACGLAACPACTECSALGPMRGCEPCYMRAGTGAGDSEPARSSDGARDHAPGAARPGADRSVTLRLPHPLTAAQSDASKRLRSFVRDGRHPLALVWAVCGAGKTEVAFAAVEEAMRRRLRALFAIPRRSVVAELAPRIRDAFPGIPVEVAYGGMRGERPAAPAPIVVATTHQALRFYRAFHLVVLDEVDAFPYRGSRMLRRAVTRAARPGARVVLMTATPDEALLRAAERGESALIRIPARHHGRPLPVPELVTCRLPDFAGSREPGGGTAQTPRAGRGAPVLPSAVVRILRCALAPRGDETGAEWPDGAAGTNGSNGTNGAGELLPPVLLFEPTVALAETMGAVLRSESGRLGLRPGAIDSVHAGDARRDEKVVRLRRGGIRMLVTTSILERGMTVDGANVVVLHADYERVFSVASLIQMAGRVGRSSRHPRGGVWFVGRRVTGAMRSARRAIEEMNEVGRRQGFVRV